MGEMYEDVPGAVETERDQQRSIWIDARGETPGESAVFSASFNNGIDTLLLTPDQLGEFKYPNGVSLATFVENGNSVTEYDEFDILVSDNIDVLREAREHDFRTTLRSQIVDNKTLENAISQLDEQRWLDYGLMELEDETNIPLEQIIAELQGDDVAVLKSVETADEAEVAFGVMDVGIDGVNLRPRDVSDVYDVAKYSGERDQQIELQTLEVTNVEHIGMGTRVCVDTTSMMSKREGMLVGSKSMGGIFVCSETHPLPYMDLRPFRVNAGASHSYVWAPEDTTYYLSELEAGREVLCVDTDGNARSVAVGRSKVEERPLLLIEAEYGEQKLNVILQDDWHVRVMGTDEEPINITDLEPGDEVLGHVCEAGRHVGVKVEEDIMEN
ncbi:3-dehydroquinate synthase II [Halorussus ruber]|uniref:3-dehydroquinate synthase II n=1 Tax=Halorussus ruber TaxID=1126238 RepID=UPI00109220F2|nr:3-dehydroquinate synthase II [Halorussus ruber]